MGRAPCCEKVGLRKGRWSAQEDEILIKYIQANGEGSWRALPKNAGLLRCGKSCRLRWINYLRSDLKRGNISAHEEDLIIQLHSSLGNRWSQIASHLPGRTDNEIKNYWNSHLSRKIYAFKRPANSDTSNGTANNVTMKRKGGKTSRWAMKKNRSNKTQQKASSEKPINHHQNNIIVTITTVPEPTTPALENEGLSIITSDDGIDFEDFMALEGGDVNKNNNNNEQDKVEGGGGGGDQQAESNNGENGDASSLKLSCGDKEIRQEACLNIEHVKSSDQLFGPLKGVQSANETSLGPKDGLTRDTKGKIQKEISEEEKGHHDEEGIDKGGELCLEDMLDSWLLQDQGSGVSCLTDERETHDDVACFRSKKPLPPPHQPNECTNTQNWFSPSPMPEYNNFWHDWEISEEDLHKESQTWDDKQNLLSWLCEDECQNITPQIDPKLPLILS